MEMLIVVAIIAVLVAVAIPTFSSQLHKARVATDWANVRSYYAQLQYDFMETGEINERLSSWSTTWIHTGLTSFQLSGQGIKLKAGSIWVAANISLMAALDTIFYYLCNEHHLDCVLNPSHELTPTRKQKNLFDLLPLWQERRTRALCKHSARGFCIFGSRSRGSGKWNGKKTAK